MKLWLPDLKPLKTITFKDELEFFKTIKAWHILAIVAIGFGGLFSWFSYIAPLLIHVSNFHVSSVSYLMVVAGAGMVVGNILGGKLADSGDPLKVTMTLLIFMVTMLILIFFFSEHKVLSIIFTFVCGALSMSIAAPINMVMLNNAKHSAMLGAAFLQAAFNVSNTLGAFFGGIPLVYGLDYNYPALVGAGMAIFGVLLCFAFLKRYQ